MFANKSSYAKTFLSTIILIAAVIIAAIFIYIELGAKSSQIPIVRAGDELPAIKLSDLEGERTTLQALTPNAEPMLINFWASWCKPCIEELPLLNEAQSFVPEVTFIAVNMKEDLDKIQSYMERYDITMTVLRDETLSWKAALAMQGYPVTILVDKQGVIQHIHTGAYSTIEEIIEQSKKLVAGEGIT